MEGGNESDLVAGLTLPDLSAISVAAILQCVLSFRGEPVYKAGATAAIRKHFGLPMIPGAVCRSSTDRQA